MIQQVDHTAVRGPAPGAASNDVKPENVGPAGVPSQHASSLASAPHPNFAKESHPLTYLFAQHDYARLLEGQTSIYGTITLRPTGTSSQAHRALVSRATGGASRSGPSTPGGAYRARKTNLISIDVDPERQKADREAEELKKAKDAKKLAAAERRKAAGGSSRSKGRNIRKAKFHARLFSDEEDFGGEEDEEEDEDEDGDLEGGGRSRVARLAGERRQPKRGTGGMYDREPEDDGFVVPDEDDDDEEGDEDDDAEEGSDGEKKRKKKEKSSSAKRGDGEGDAPLEDLEIAEKELEDQAREAKRRRKEGPISSSQGDAMDLDSGGEGKAPAEEAAPQGRKRLVIESDEEE